MLEYNARFGDPETQAILVRLESDLVDALEACIDGTSCGDRDALEPGRVGLRGGEFVRISGRYKTGLPISGLEAAARIPGVEVFHSGTALRDGQMVTAGGRVLGVTAAAESLQEALERAYEAMAEIQFEGMYYRRDIGHRALAKAE